MRQLPAVFSLPPFSSIGKSLNAFSRHFRDKRTRQNFITIASSIIYSGSPLFSEAAKISSAPKNTIKALSHFLQSSSWQKAVIDKMRLSLINKFLKDIQFIALDFTALCKAGKHFEYLSKVYDGRDKKIKPGYSLLLALGISGDTTIKLPVQHRLITYKHNFKSENLEIVQFLDNLKSLEMPLFKLKNIVFLGDRGFDRKPVLEKIAGEQWHYIIQAKKTKKVKLSNNQQLLMADLATGFYENVFIKYWRFFCNLKVEMIKDKKEKKLKKVIWLTNLNEKEFSISKIYRKRWKIEDANKDIKGNYGLEKFRVRKWKAIQRITSLALFCYTLYTTISITRNRLLKGLKKSVIILTGRQRTASLKTIKALRSLAEIINNFALIALIQLNFAKIYQDYG